MYVDVIITTRIDNLTPDKWSNCCMLDRTCNKYKSVQQTSISMILSDISVSNTTEPSGYDKPKLHFKYIVTVFSILQNTSVNWSPPHISNNYRPPYIKRLTSPFGGYIDHQKL